MGTGWIKACITLATSAVAGVSYGQASFTDIGTFPGHYRSYATAVSRDGLVVTGWSYGFGYSRAFRWTQAHGLEDLGTIPNATWQQRDFRPSAISDDGTVIVGGDNCDLCAITHAFRWT